MSPLICLYMSLKCTPQMSQILSMNINTKVQLNYNGYPWRVSSAPSIDTVVSNQYPGHVFDSEF